MKSDELKVVLMDGYLVVMLDVMMVEQMDGCLVA